MHKPSSLIIGVGEITMYNLFMKSKHLRDVWPSRPTKAGFFYEREEVEVFLVFRTVAISRNRSGPTSSYLAKNDPRIGLCLNLEYC